MVPNTAIGVAGILCFWIRDPKFWQGGFDVLDKLVSELENLPVKKAVKAKSKKAGVKSKKVAVKKKAKKHLPP